MDDTAPLTMDAMRPSQAFGAPPAPSTFDPWHWLRPVFRALRAAAARTAPAGRDGTPRDAAAKGPRDAAPPCLEACFGA